MRAAASRGGLAASCRRRVAASVAGVPAALTGALSRTPLPGTPLATTALRRHFVLAAVGRGTTATAILRRSP
jgi:hypothetical protein